MPLLAGKFKELFDPKWQHKFICLRLFQIAVKGDFGQHNSGKQVTLVGPYPQHFQSVDIGLGSGRFVTSQQFNVGKPCFCYRHSVLDYFETGFGSPQVFENERRLLPYTNHGPIIQKLCTI